MINYKTYKIRFGEKIKNGDYHVPITEDVFNLLSKPNRFAVGFKNEITFALMEDVFISLCKSIMTNDSDGRLKAYKKLANVIKDVLEKNKDNPDVLIQRYYDVSPSPEEKELFVSNPLVKAKVDVTSKISGVLSGLAKFYRAINTEVGGSVYNALLKEKTDVLDLVYEQKSKGSIIAYYPETITLLIDTWSRRIQTYESYSNSLKLINRSLKNAGR